MDVIFEGAQGRGSSTARGSCGSSSIWTTGGGDTDRPRRGGNVARVHRPQCWNGATAPGHAQGKHAPENE